jgi:hypothetical protein
LADYIGVQRGLASERMGASSWAVGSNDDFVRQEQLSRPSKSRQWAGVPPAHCVTSDFSLLRDLQRVIDFDPKVSHCAFKSMYLCP